MIASFKLVKSAISKGFDLFDSFSSITSLYSKDGKHVYYTNYGVMYSGLSDGYISAPTLTTLQDWLRDNHKKEVVVIPFALDTMDKKSEVKYYYFIGEKFYGFINRDKEKPYDTHNEALEEGIKKAINKL